MKIQSKAIEEKMYTVLMAEPVFIINETVAQPVNCCYNDHRISQFYIEQITHKHTFSSGASNIYLGRQKTYWSVWKLFTNRQISTFVKKINLTIVMPRRVGLTRYTDGGPPLTCCFSQKV